MSPADHLLPEDPNTSIDPYATLNLSESATEAEIRSAYKKLALKNHPDKVDADKREVAHKDFQNIAFAYAILSDPKRKRRYDTTGSTAESALDDEDFDWTDFFRARYTEVTAEKLQEFEAAYRNGGEERSDLLEAYEKHKGRMDKIYEEVMLSNPLNDEERYQQIIQQAIETGSVEEYSAFVNESEKSRKRRIDRARREAKEADEHAKELKEEKRNGKKGRRHNPEDDQSEGSEEGNDDDNANDEDEDDDSDDEDESRSRKAKATAKSASKARSKNPTKPAGAGMGGLAAMIQRRQQSRANTFLDDLEARYAPKSGKGRKRTPLEEPPEEAFAATAARKGGKKSKK